MSEVITKALEEHGAAVKSVLDKQTSMENDLRTVKSNINDIEQEFARLPAGEYINKPKQGMALRGFLESTQLENMRKGARETGRVELSSVSIKSLVNEGLGQDGDTGHQSQTQRNPAIFNDPRVANTLIANLPSISVTANVYEFTQLAGLTGGADYQAKEGDTKAETGVDFSVVETSIATIAHWTRASVQVLDDAPTLQQYVGSLLTYGVLSKLEREIINGNGEGKNINGLINQAQAFTSQADTVTDQIGEAVADLRAKGWVPSLVVVHPLDWYAITSSKADSSGIYLIGSPQNPASQTLWGTQVVLSSNLERGTSLVLDSSQVAILDRMQPTLLASRFDGNNMTANLVTILAELRSGLAVFSPDAIYKLTVSANADDGDSENP